MALERPERSPPLSCTAASWNTSVFASWMANQMPTGLLAAESRARVADEEAPSVLGTKVALPTKLQSRDVEIGGSCVELEAGGKRPAAAQVERRSRLG